MIEMFRSNYFFCLVFIISILSCRPEVENKQKTKHESSLPQLETTNGKSIVFITFDELGASFLGSYGSGVNSSPTMDRLARDGMKFNRCYATSPVCAPNRATFLTGRSPVVHGIIFNNLALASDMPTYAHVLQRHGYHTGVFGKMHQTPMWKEEPEDLKFMGFDEGILIEDDKWGDWLKWVEREHPDQFDNALSLTWGEPQGKYFQKYKKRRVKAIDSILNPIKDGSFWAAAYESPVSIEAHDNTFITNESIKFLQRHRKQQRDRPFLLRISYVEPHDPYNPPAPYSTLFNAKDMPDPIPMNWDMDRLKMLAGTLDHLGIHQLNGEPEKMKKLRALFHGSIKFLDDQVARIESHLKENGMWENTIIIISTDHGEMMGDHGLITKGSKHYDSGIRMPLIVAGGGVQAGETNRLTSALDFYPSILSFAAVPDNHIPPNEGRSFSHDCFGKPTEGWQQVVLWACENGGGAYSVITEDGWRLTRFVDEEGTRLDAGQMFNLKNDPAEQNDLYYDPNYIDKKLELFERMVKEMSRPSRIPQYRNMPLIDSVKIMRSYKDRSDRGQDGMPIYQSSKSEYILN